MKYFIRNANNNSLVLIDEFGTGTEPQLGGSIAEATLETLNKNSTYGVITTHYTNIKLAAERLSGLINGAMLFDSKEMQPLYRLQIGKPGSSFAFEIAKKIGFPTNVLNNAKQKSGGKHVRFDQQLQQLEIDKIKLQKQQHKADSSDASLTKMIDEYSELIGELERSKKEIMKDAKEQALKIIEASNKAVEKTIRDIKEAGAEKEKTKEIREELKKKKVEIAENEESRIKIKKKKKKAIVTPTKKPIISGPIKQGDFVKMINSKTIGEVISVSGQDVEINVNDLILKTTLSKIEKTSEPKQVTTRRRGYNSIVNDINEKAANFQLSLDLRGQRADEAMSALQKYIDEAILLNMKEVSILHGKGYGILREIIREYLQSVDEIIKYGDAPIEMGGSGITRIYF